jgi:hypothetical protein
MSSTALSRLLTARAKALQPAALANPKPEPEPVQAPKKSAFVRPPEQPGDWTTTWNDGQVIAERLVGGRRIFLRYNAIKNRH